MEGRGEASSCGQRSGRSSKVKGEWKEGGRCVPADFGQITGGGARG